MHLCSTTLGYIFIYNVQNEHHNWSNSLGLLLDINVIKAEHNTLQIVNLYRATSNMFRATKSLYLVARRATTSYQLTLSPAYNDIRKLYIDTDKLDSATEYHFINLMNTDNRDTIIKLANFVSCMFKIRQQLYETRVC